MSGWLTRATEVFQSLDKASTEQLLPITIHRDTGCQRLIRSEKPLRHRQSISRRARGKLAEHCGDIRRKHRPGLLQLVTSMEQQRLSRLVSRYLSHDGQRNRG